jgi:hypothetical protein
MNKYFVYAKNECLYCSIRKDTIANQICHVVVGKSKKKICVIFCLFPHVG